MALVQRRIDAKFALANGNFDGGGNTATLSGLRISARITHAGSPGMGLAEIAIYGMTLSKMNQLSTIGTQYNAISKNTVTLQAGDISSGMAEVFEGTITSAYVDAQAMPDACLRVMAVAGGVEAIKPAAPTSYQGSTDITTILKRIASDAGLAFEGAVSVMLSNPYLWGSPRSQISSAAEAAGVEWTIDKGTLAIWKTGKARAGDAILISPDTGLVGYPAFNQVNVVVQTLFNSNLRLGAKITIQSSLSGACGDWVIQTIDHDLDAMVPHGRWLSTITAFSVSAAPA